MHRPRFRIVRSLFRVMLFNVILTRGSYLVGTGILGGVYLVDWLHQFSATFGSSLAARSAVALAVAIGLCFGLRQSAPTVPIENNDTQPRSRMNFISGLGLIHLGLAVWTIVFPNLLDMLFSFVGRIGIETMSQVVVQCAVFGIAATTALTVPVIWLAQLPFRLAETDRQFELNGRPSDAAEQPHADFRIGVPSSGLSALLPKILIGTAIGIALSIFALAPAVGVHQSGLIAVLFSSLVGLADVVRQFRPQLPWFRLSRHGHLNSADSASAPTDQRKSKTDARLPVEEFALPVAAITQFCFTCVAIGVLLAALSRLLHQLMPVATWVVFSECAFMLLGIAGGLAWCKRLMSRGPVESPRWIAARQVSRAACILTIWPVCMIVAFPVLINMVLFFNAHISQVWMTIAARSMVLGIVMLPVGFGCGLMLAAHGVWANTIATAPAAQSRKRVGHTLNVPAFAPLLIVAGVLVSHWLLLPRIGVAASLIAVAWITLAQLAVRWWQLRSRPTGRLQRVAMFVTICVTIAAPIWRHRYDPSLSAKLLFDTNVFLANRMGQDSSLLPFLNEGRRVAVHEGDRGTFTVWKHRGSQLQIRECGIPKWIVSSDTSICPHYPPETLQVIVPLVLHDRPQRILLLGLGGGQSLTTCLAFPIQEIACAEVDASLVQLVTTTINAETGMNPLADDRVRIFPLDPTLAVECRDRPFDVIVSSPDQCALTQSASQFTVEFYRSVAARLSADGIFCQRFQYFDFGADSIRIMAASFQAAFDHIVAVEVAAGEMLFLGTNSVSGMTRPDLVVRLQAPHVRQALSLCGWDWSVLLNLDAYESDALAKIASETPALVNTRGNGRSAFRLPFDVMRWANKSNEIRTLLAQHSGRFLEWIGEDGESPEVLRRLSEVTAQRKLMTEHPDQYWVYRKAVKEQVTQQPRSVIRQVSHEAPRSQLHPEDKRRLRYFKALANAAEQPQPSPTSVDKVVAFRAPYDPLLSYFLYEEAAALLARSQPRDVQAELALRLHAVYYAAPGNRSIRNIVASLKLIVEFPESIPDPARRWDQLNALLQILKGRWYLRSSTPPESTQIVLNDIKQSISAAESAFTTMQVLAAQAGVTDNQWQARRKVLDKSLVRPLRTYRATLQPHLYRERAKSKQAAMTET